MAATDCSQRTTRYEYDEAGELSAEIDSAGQRTGYGWDGAGRLAQVLTPDGIGQRTTRDPWGRITGQQRGKDGQQESTQWHYDDAGRLIEQRQGAGQVTRWQLDSASRVQMLIDGNGQSTEFEYDGADRLLGEQHYAHDATGRILSSRNIETGTAQHARNDPLWHSRGEAPQQKPGKEEYFRWDDADNALPSAPGFADTASTGRVERNRVRVWQDIRYEYDGLGHVVRKQSGKRQTLKLKWNSESQLIASTTEQPRVSTQHVRYHYDALGRRIGKTTRFGTTWFNWSGMRLIQEERGARVITTVYEDQDSYVPLARIEHGKDQREISEKQIFYSHTDINGAPEELTSHDGIVAWKARYRTWGNTALEEWDHQYACYENTVEDRSQNIRLQGQYLDTETGLHYNTFRYYDPDIGRFASQDPIGLLGGLNLYQYAPNPSLWIDPWGWNKNSNAAVGDWVLYQVRDPKTGIAKIGIGKAEDVMANGDNRRSVASARKVAKKDVNFKNAKLEILGTYKNITKGEMKEIEAAKVRELRSQGHALPHNRERDRRYRYN